MNKGRSTPPFPKLITHHKTKTEKYKRHFCVSQYENVDWLAGCETINELDCWPCFHFCNKYEGLFGFNHLSYVQQKHSKSQTHVQCYLPLKLFGIQRKVDLLLNTQHSNIITKHSEKVKNDIILLQFIDAFCALANQEFPFQGHGDWSTSLINPYPTAFPYGNGMVLHFYQQQESSTTKTVHRVINKGLKTYV